MKRQHCRLLTFVLACWLAIEPLAVALAQDTPPVALPTPTVDTRALPAGLVPAGDIVLPGEYLQKMLQLRAGNNEARRADRAWGEWATTLGNSYGVMDEGNEDVFSFYGALGAVRDVGQSIGAFAARDLAQGAGVVAKITKYCSMAFAFASRIGVGRWGTNLFTALTRHLDHLEAFIANNKTLQFCQFTNPPIQWIDAAHPVEGTQAYFQWVRAKATGGASEMSTSQGVARSLGIGLTVLAAGLAAFRLATSDDTHGGRWTSYDTVKNGITGGLSALVLIAMLCPPPLGQILQIGLLVWGIANFLGDFLGDYQRRWRAAYRASFWFLYENDLQFKSFYENRNALRTEEKAASLLLAERQFGAVLASQTPQTDDEKKSYERGQRVYASMQKNGVLMSYYSRGDFVQPDLPVDRMCELWRKKADFMSWKPTEKEADAAKKRGFFGRVLNAVNPMTWVAWAGNKIQSKDYERELAANNFPRTWFNPDYYLIKKYQSFQLMKKARGGVYDTVALRLEQAPFNYLPLIAIEPGAITPAVLEEAVQADAMAVGQKEMVALRGLVKSSIKTVKEKYTDMTTRLRGFRDQECIDKIEAKIKALNALQQACERDATAPVDDAVWAELSRAFGLRWANSGTAKTPRNVISQHKATIEQALQMLPIVNGMQAVEFILMEDTILANRDTARLMQKFGEDRLNAAQSVGTDFKNPEIKRFITEGSFANEQGSTFRDWLGEIYPVAEELRKASDLFLDEVRDYQSAVSDFPVSDITQALDELNRLQSELKELVTAWHRVAAANGVRMVFAAENEKIFPAAGYRHPLSGKPVIDPDAALPQGE